MSDMTAPEPPPIEADLSDLEEQQSKWPSVIGGLSLAYAIGGLLCQAAAGAWVFLGEILASMGGFDMTVPMPFKLTMLFLVVLTTGVGLLMLVGAAGLLRRRRAGVRRLRLWAVLRVVLVFVGLLVTIMTAPAQVQMQRSVTEWQNEQLRDAGRADRIREVTDEELWAGILRNSLIFSGVFMAYPVFLGVYLSRRKIEEEIREWP